MPGGRVLAPRDVSDRDIEEVVRVEQLVLHPGLDRAEPCKPVGLHLELRGVRHEAKEHALAVPVRGRREDDDVIAAVLVLAPSDHRDSTAVDFGGIDHELRGLRDGRRDRLRSEALGESSASRRRALKRERTGRRRTVFPEVRVTIPRVGSHKITQCALRIVGLPSAARSSPPPSTPPPRRSAVASVSRGSLFRRSGSPHWFIKLWIDGNRHRESTGTDDRELALAYLQRRLHEARVDRFVASPERITFGEMRELLLANYRFKRNRTDPRRHVRRLAESFGDLLGEEITEERIAEYSRKRMERDRMTPATLRRELAILKRMLRLASSRLPRVPLVDMPRVDNARQGFFEEEELQAVLSKLPPHARNLVEFLYLTGWRSSEAFRLQWSDVDWRRQTVWLRDSKNREPRIFPFKYHARVEQVLREQREAVSRWERQHGRLCSSVFHWRGRPLQKLRRSWQSACRAAGLEGRLLHDFRRTAVRNLIRAGVQQAIAMKITGHKTDSVFRRYLIVDEELLAQATGAVAELLGDHRRVAERKPE